MAEPFVPADWPLPAPLEHPMFQLAALGPEHNESDYIAWSTSIEHIRNTPGFAIGNWGTDAWPQPMSVADNLADLQRHAHEFEERTAFAYTVLRPHSAEVIGCVYIDPDDTGAPGAMVRCWVSAHCAELDTVLADAIAQWLSVKWPFSSARFPGRRHGQCGQGSSS